MREVCYILVGPHLIHSDSGSETRIPDSAERWKVIWEYRNTITEIAHSHPNGCLDFSDEDLTTIEAVEAGIGRKLIWSIVTKDRIVSRKDGADINRAEPPWWVDSLRRFSYEDFETKPRKEEL